jgi:hypothetical protein
VPAGASQLSVNLNDGTTILEGAIPAALMAIAQGTLFILDQFLFLEGSTQAGMGNRSTN